MIKRIFTLGVIGLALVACNNDKKTEQKTNSNTGKVENVETKEEEKAIPKAISDSAGVYTQKFILEKGKTYPFSSVQKEVQTIKDPSGKSMKGTQEIVDERNIVVNDFQNGVYDLTINILGKKMTSIADGKTVVIDTKQPAPKDEQLKNIWTINNTLVGSKFSVKMKENGEVISVKGIDELYKKVEKAITPFVKEAEQKKQFVEYFKQGFNEKMLKEEFSAGINILPKKGVKLGESWTISENIDPEGKVKSNITYTLNKIENGVAEVSVTGNIPAKSNKQTQNGITMIMSVEGSQNGTLKIDENSGWILSSQMNIKTTNKQTMTDGKRTETMTAVSENTVAVN